MYNVFIIDDEPWSREVVKALGEWEKLGLRVAGEAEDGTEGLRLIGERLPDIVVTDMRMPGIDGAELLHALHERHPGTKLIVMSGYDDFVYTKGAIRSKAVEYLLKPISPEDLNAALARCKEELDRESGPRSSIFASGEAMQRYAGYRERIYGSLLSLDKERIAASFAAMATGLAEGAIGAMEAGGPGRIAGDLLLMLERFLSEQETTLEKLLRDVAGPGAGAAVGAGSGAGAGAALGAGVATGVGAGVIRNGATPGEAALAVGELYALAVDGLLALRQARGRLEMEDVLGYIDAHFQDAISLETVAGQFLVSREHLSRAFKARTGENLSDYIVRKRMEKARSLIAEERLPIKHAAQLSGYEDIAYFYRVFKKHFGITPGDLRKE
jgi:two-component system response regulator YesN